MKKIFTFMLSLAMVVGAHAQTTVSPKAAAQKAADLFQKSSNVSAAKAISSGSGTTAAEPKLAYVSVLNGDTCFYVFNNPEGGYAIIGGDLASREVLATVSEGSFDINAIPENVKSWLSVYSQEISSAKKSGIVSSSVTAVTGEDIANLCPTTWDQGAPYNNMCPILPNIEYFQKKLDDDDKPYAGQHAATGCVATAAAQALYAVYAKTGKMATHTTKDIQMTFNFCDDDDNTIATTDEMTFSSSTTLDWSNMKTTYNTTDEGASANAVATLMSLMGFVSKMGYGAESGAFGSDLADGLKTYLNMTANDEARDSTLYSTDAWEQKVYDDLAAGRPVIYLGNASDGTGGHCFVVDGYKKDATYGALFHINWGWAGVGDTYFTISAVNGQPEKGENSNMAPVNTGTGAGQGVYSHGHEAIFGLAYNGQDTPPAPSAITVVDAQDTTVAPVAVKIMRNGQFIIVKDGKQFNAAGQQM